MHSITELSLQIRSDDAFPTDCCIDCVNKLQTFHEYVQQCINFQNRLLELSTLNNSQHAHNNIKIELDFQDLDHFKKESFDTDEADQFDVSQVFKTILPMYHFNVIIMLFFIFAD